MDDYFAEVEERYHAGLPDLPCTITETIREVDGSVSQYRYTDVVFDLESAGKKQGDKTIPMRIAFEASRRKKIA